MTTLKSVSFFFIKGLLDQPGFPVFWTDCSLPRLCHQCFALERIPMVTWVLIEFFLSFSCFFFFTDLITEQITEDYDFLPPNSYYIGCQYFKVKFYYRLSISYGFFHVLREILKDVLAPLLCTNTGYYH